VKFRPRIGPPRPQLSLLRAVLLSPLWAVPFALFFGTLFGASWPTYRLCYAESLVFTVVIRVALWATGRWIAPRVLRRMAGSEDVALGATYAIVVVVASYASAFLVQRLLAHDFLVGPRELLVTGMWSLLFATLFMGIVYARLFHQRAVDRAAQVERIRGELARAELRALRSQVNPHFLFNTLNSIAALIAENPAAAEDLTTRLAEVFRYALASSREETSRFGDELEFLRTCLAIERVRFGDRLRIEEAIEPGLEDVRVPSLLFQPLVENAVQYAVSPRAEGGRVRLEARREGDTLRFTVADDGPGMTAGAAPAGHGVGLESVRERLRLNGDGHALAIDSPPGGGTRVTVTMPLVPAGPAASSPPAGAGEPPRCP